MAEVRKMAFELMAKHGLDVKIYRHWWHDVDYKPKYIYFDSSKKVWVKDSGGRCCDYQELSEQDDWAVYK